MTLEVLVIAVVRVVGSLPVLRWPLAGGILAILVDLSDLLLFPNVLEPWFLLVAALHHRWNQVPWNGRRLAGSLAMLLALKELQEWALHWARLFDGITALEAIDLAWRWLNGG